MPLCYVVDFAVVVVEAVRVCVCVRVDQSDSFVIPFYESAIGCVDCCICLLYSVFMLSKQTQGQLMPGSVI